MSVDSNAVPDVLPVLSRGKHRNARKGACFMELASYLAGERWSDHPKCTHPLLATLARLVNDFTADEARPRLAVLIPSVIGLTGNDVRIDATITLRSARTALPVVSAERQRVLAVAIMSSERLLAELDGLEEHGLSSESAQALDEVPHAREWAIRFTRGMRMSAKGFRRHAGPSAVRCAVQGIARSCASNSDELMFELLDGVIRDCAALMDDREQPVDPARWIEACELTH